MVNNKWTRLGLLIVLFGLLLAVRGFESLFYDPLITYFKSDYLHMKLYEIDKPKFIFFTFLRYLINSVLSLGIIWLFFQRNDFLKFSAWFYFVGFVVLMSVFILLMRNNFESNYLIAFYIRRFLIQPLFLLLLLPALHYQKTVSK